MIQARTPERASELIKKGLDGGTDAFAIQIDQLERETAQRAVTESFLKKWAASRFMLPITAII